jgi:hypothetical protein
MPDGKLRPEVQRLEEAIREALLLAQDPFFVVAWQEIPPIERNRPVQVREAFPIVRPEFFLGFARNVPDLP